MVFGKAGPLLISLSQILVLGLYGLGLFDLLNIIFFYYLGIILEF